MVICIFYSVGVFFDTVVDPPFECNPFWIATQIFSIGSVECELWFTGSREKFELGNNVNHKNIDKKNSRTGEPNYENQAYA
jgi:hypothetical protein